MLRDKGENAMLQCRTLSATARARERRQSRKREQEAGGIACRTRLVVVALGTLVTHLKYLKWLPGVLAQRWWREQPSSFCSQSTKVTNTRCNNTRCMQHNKHSLHASAACKCFFGVLHAVCCKRSVASLYYKRCVQGSLCHGCARVSCTPHGERRWFLYAIWCV